MGYATVSDFRANVAKYLDEVIADRTELVITRQNNESVVMIPLADWEGIQETLYLLSNPANAAELRASIAELNAGDSAERALLKP
jgi:antitoxin YefM